MTGKEATDILQSIDKEKWNEAGEILKYLVKNMKGKAPQGGNWDELTQTQKMVIITGFAIEYGRRTPGKNSNEQRRTTSETAGTTGTAD